MASVGQALDFFLKLSTALLLAASGAMSLSVSYNKMANRLPSKGVCGRQASALCCGACSHSFLTETAGGALPAHLTVEDIEATCAGPPPQAQHMSESESRASPGMLLEETSLGGLAGLMEPA